MPPIQREWTIGRHTFHFEAPDLLWSKLQGGCTLEQAVQMVNLYRELGTAHPFFIMGDMETAEGMESEARRYVSEHVRSEWILGVIYFKTRLLHKALAMGLLLAAEMTRAEKSTLRGKIHFVSSQAKARALLEQLREQRGGNST
ncbi:hypothetical protein [Melittangium boletus]|uniref:Uncharacterized protein n=1 Tax=Melittangium boletus DSM 14713 TaxID=1294270 RepID=A0A250IFF1_9BACT|nr:hypothetical protein [Melittangium boletus]ATB29978.1 hypothetical protein MEBOL_003433 [Melittangium boletus DSM 14713]